MKVQLTYDEPSQISTDLLVVILDGSTDVSKRFHNLRGSSLDETVRRVERSVKDKRLKTDYFTELGGKARHLLVLTTSANSGHKLSETVKTCVARSIRVAGNHGLDRVSIVMNTNEALPLIGEVVEGAILGSYSFDKYKTEKSTLNKVRVQIVGLKAHDKHNQSCLDRYTLVSGVINEARDMINEPGCAVVPETMANAARKIAKDADLDVKVWDEKKLAKEGYNGLVQVGRGSVHPPRLIRLSYRARKAKHHLAFVGKGVTFDTGGISIKPSDNMWRMKGDMSGGAAVLFAMKAIGKLRPDVHVTGIVPAAENIPDANAQLPGDIFYAKNGKSIMVDNTDAEGRLILTDGLYLAGEEKATHILDIATLTGAVVQALGPSIAGVLGNNRDLIQAVIRSGQNQGEQFWELPLPEEYRETLKDKCADLKNVGEPYARASMAGLFLREFVPEGAAWAHLDIAGPFIREKDWKYYEAGAIGFGLKTLVDLAERFED